MGKDFFPLASEITCILTLNIMKYRRHTEINGVVKQATEANENALNCRKNLTAFSNTNIIINIIILQRWKITGIHLYWLR